MVRQLLCSHRRNSKSPSGWTKRLIKAQRAGASSPFLDRRGFLSSAPTEHKSGTMQGRPSRGHGNLKWIIKMHESVARDSESETKPPAQSGFNKMSFLLHIPVWSCNDLSPFELFKTSVSDQTLSSEEWDTHTHTRTKKKPSCSQVSGSRVRFP